jgi:hypothetical protein
MSTALALATLPVRIGQPWPEQGGDLAAILRAPPVDGIEQPLIALIAAGRKHEFKSTWGEYGQDVAGARSRLDGRANTDAMAAAGCKAAQRVRKLDIDGHSDWFIPALGQLNAAAANAPELFDPKSVLWTSTQLSAHIAFVQDFEYGDSDWNGKDDRWQVRPFRGFALESLTPSTLAAEGGSRAIVNAELLAAARLGLQIAAAAADEHLDEDEHRAAMLALEPIRAAIAKVAGSAA